MHYEIITIVAADVGRSFHTGIETKAKPSRSAPPYSDILPKYRELSHDLETINGKKVHITTKFYAPDIIVVEAHAIVDDLFAKDVVDFKKEMLIVCSNLARKRDHFADICEEYTMFCISGYKHISQFDRYKSHIVGLMRSEVEEMDKDVVDSALKESSLKYSSNDLVIVGWDGAVLFSDNPAEFAEIIEVLIAGNIQLLKIRLLNKELEDGIDSINKNILAKRIGWFNLRKTLMHIVQLRTSSLQDLEHTRANINLLGDWYTATLYALASKKFHLDEKMAEVNKRLDVLEDVYEMFTERLNSSYMLILELLVVIMILYEIIVPLI